MYTLSKILLFWRVDQYRCATKIKAKLAPVIFESIKYMKSAYTILHLVYSLYFNQTTDKTIKKNEKTKTLDYDSCTRLAPINSVEFS